MKTLSQMIKDAEERFNQKLEQREDKGGFTYLYEGRDELSSEAIKDFLKTELANIVKESFKNTRVEEEEQKPCHEINLTQTRYWCASCKNDTGKCEVVELNDKRNEALSDKQEMENQFLNN